MKPDKQQRERYVEHKCQRSEAIDFDWRWAVLDTSKLRETGMQPYPYVAFCATERACKKIVSALNAVRYGEDKG